MTKELKSFSQIQLDNVSISTSDYKEDSDIKSKVKTKTAYISNAEIKDGEPARFSTAQMAKIEEFGLRVYNSEAGDEFLIVRFVKDTWVYDTSTNTKWVTLYDNTIKNFNLQPANVIIQFIKSTVRGQNDFFRLIAIQVDNYQASISEFSNKLFDEVDGVEYNQVLESDKGDQLGISAPQP